MPSTANDLAYALRPSLWTSEVLNFDLDPWQKTVLDSGGKKILLCCSRQAGKTLVSAILALHTAIFKPDSLDLCLSPTLRQSSELFHVVSRLYDIDPAIPSKAESVLKLELETGSRIISLPGQESSVRGYASVALLVVDEAARVPDDLYYSIKPMLAVSRGRMIGLSTPFGKRGWYFKEWSEGEGWQKHTITAEECPRISKEFLEEERRSMPDAWFRAEYMAEFTDTINSVFSFDQVMGAVSQDVEPLDFGGAA